MSAVLQAAIAHIRMIDADHPVSLVSYERRLSLTLYSPKKCI